MQADRFNVSMGDSAESGSRFGSPTRAAPRRASYGPDSHCLVAGAPKGQSPRHHMLSGDHALDFAGYDVAFLPLGSPPPGQPGRRRPGPCEGGRQASRPAPAVCSFRYPTGCLHFHLGAAADGPHLMVGLGAPTSPARLRPCE